MKNLLVLIFILFGASTCFAANSVIDFADTFTYNPREGIRVQAFSPNPLLTQLVGDNLSHTITLSTTQASSLAPILYFRLSFNGTGTGCIVRPMYSATKASYVAYPVASQTVFALGIHPNTKFINYSSCYN